VPFTATDVVGGPTVGDSETAGAAAMAEAAGKHARIVPTIPTKAKRARTDPPVQSEPSSQQYGPQHSAVFPPTVRPDSSAAGPAGAWPAAEQFSCLRALVAAGAAV